jgi:Fe-S-cluster containining protein
MAPRYVCDRCGACCRHLIVEADLIDYLREPRLVELDPSYAGKSHEEIFHRLDDTGRVIHIACGTARPCGFLNPDQTCGIYPTRPNDCVGMLAGDEQCQFARQAAGLPPLLPVET